MQIICVSRGSQSQGENFAKKLASNLGYECISREQILEEATRRKIPIGKVETAIVKPHRSSEKLARYLVRFKALATTIICEKALKNNIVYHGRTGHLLLQGVDNILRLRIVTDIEHRIGYVVSKFGLSREKAKHYIEQIEEDRRRWVKKFYNVDWDVFTLYDFVINLSQMGVDNAASSICQFTQLPEFQLTPASRNSLEDLYLASRAHLLLTDDPRTAHLDLKVRADRGNILVTYLYQHAKYVPSISEVLRNLEDVKEIVCTQAQTSILWIQESFKVDDASYREVLSLANRWNAAVELLKLVPMQEGECISLADEQPVERAEPWPDAGIIESEDKEDNIPEDISKIYERLLNDGKAGGRRLVSCSQKALLNAIGYSANYRMIIMDNVFLQKGEAIRKRLRQEWSNYISDSSKSPVVALDEIISQYRFGFSQYLRMAAAALLTALVIIMIFKFDNQIITFLSREGPKWRILSTSIIVIFVPLFAFVYSTFTGLLLKLFRFD
ncbi:MAG: hypothetical protein DRP46_10280 [Candidatus Zixiibacteriota bacterium]|nr:MAG: hypothetical protein DRP46_10280 [candidate division Zixibacteria bacterium]